MAHFRTYGDFLDFRFLDNKAKRETYYVTLYEIINIQFVKQPTGLIDG